LWLSLGYLAFTIAVFVAGPFDWPVKNWPELLAFLAAVLLGILVGYRIAVVHGRPRAGSLQRWHVVIVIGSLSSLVLLFPASYIYAGKMPWDVITALGDQMAAYDTLQERLQTTAGIRTPLALARMLTWPFVFAVLPLGILHWTEMGIRLRALVALCIASMIVLSILRGTDRENADLIIVLGSVLLVLSARSLVQRRERLAAFLARHLRTAVVAVVVVGLAAAFFVHRKEQRAVFTDQVVCVFDVSARARKVCARPDHPLLHPFGERTRFALSMLSAYLSEGYYGLSLALDLNFTTTWGLGHAPFAMALYRSLTGDNALYERSYTFRLRELGWGDFSLWSTMFPWFANDISFLAVPILMIFFGWVLGASWYDAVFARNDRAAVVFAFMLILVAYIPANSQLTLVSDHYFAAVAWGLFWLIGRYGADQTAGAATGSR